MRFKKFSLFWENLNFYQYLCNRYETLSLHGKF